MRTSVRISLSAALLSLAIPAVSGGNLRAETEKAGGKNLLLPERWADKFHTGDWKVEDSMIMCDSKNNKANRNCFQNDVKLNQETPLPIVITVWNKAENVTGGYSLFVDFVCKGEPNASHGMTAPFPNGTHDWVRRKMVVIAGKPLDQANPHLWFEHQPSGKVWYKDIDVHQVDSKETLADLEGITGESLRSYDRNATKDAVCVGLVGGEPEVIADVMVKNFSIPKDKVLNLFQVPPSRNLYYSESDVIASCWAADLKKGDVEELYSKKRAMSLDAFAKELQLDEAAVGTVKEKVKQLGAEISDAKIKTILSIIENVKAKYR